MSLDKLATINSLQVLPFYDLDDREFSFVIGNWTGQFDELMKSDLYNILPNPDKNDEADPDSIFNNPQSEYYSVSKLNNLSHTTQGKGIFLFHCNIRSLTKNLTLLNDMLYFLDSKPDVMAITETRLSSNSVTNLDISNYNFFHTDSPTPAGGAAIYVNKALKAIPRPDLKIDLPLVESCWVEIDPNNNRKHIMIGCIYKHPTANVEEFTTKFDELLNQLNPNKYDMYIMGDMNIDLLKYHCHQQTERYLDMIYSFNLLPVITKPTRITSHTATLIDHIYTNTINRLTSGIATVDISDHLPVFCLVDTPLKKQTKQNMYFRDYSKFNTESYLLDIYSIDWNAIADQCNDLHEVTARTIDAIELIVEKHAPKIKLSRNQQRLLKKPWLTRGIVKSINSKHAMYKTHFLSNDPAKIAKYKKYSNKINQLKNISKKTYFCRHFEMCKSNLKATWKLIGTLIKRKTKSQTTPQKIARNNKIYTSTEDIADQFNKHFINVGPNLASKIDKSNENPTQYISSPLINSFVMENVTEAQVSNLFKNLDINKASIGIPNKLIKIAAEPLSAPFTQIYNQSIETGVVPNILKISQVTPVYKNGDATDPANYRPISTLSSFSKVLEKLIYNQLYNFLEKYSILYKYQFGFRKGYSTEQAILEITDSLKKAMDKKLVTCGLFLDFSKAFDTINHDILLSKLYSYGIRGNPLRWFESYLYNRNQVVKIGDTISSSQTIICGIPQGSTLGPLLFLLYINDLPNCSSKLSFRIFADDTNMFYTSNNLRNLESVMNEEFKLVVKYCAINKLSINFSKTNYILVSSSRLSGSINVNDIKVQSQIKYLGAYIDQHLNWGPQIKHINNKLAKNIGIITKLRHYVNLHTLKQLYYSFIYPYLTYAITSWGSACKTRLNKIRTKQNKCIRSIFFAHSRENATPYYNLLDILKLDNTFKLKVALFAHKIINNPTGIPAIFSGTLPLASDFHSHYTRFVSNLNFRRPLVHNNYGASTFTFIASKIWETIPLYLKKLCYYPFSKQYKLYLLNSQSVS